MAAQPLLSVLRQLPAQSCSFAMQFADRHWPPVARLWTSFLIAVGFDLPVPARAAVLRLVQTEERQHLLPVEKEGYWRFDRA